MIRLIDVETAAVAAGVSTRTIHRWITAGWLGGIRTSNGWRTTTGHVELAKERARRARQRRVA